MNELSNNLLSAPTSLVPEKQTEELNWVKKNKTNKNDKKKYLRLPLGSVGGGT